MAANVPVAAACGQYKVPFDQAEGGAGGADPGEPGGAGAGAGMGEAGATAQGGAGGVVDGPTITIRFRAHTDPFAHDDGLNGQTPISHSSGVRKLQLFKDPSDPNPITVFDFGSTFVEIGYDDGDDTSVYTLPAKSLPTGMYTMARVVHSHVRYRVSSTMHTNGLSLPGEFDNMQVLSDGTLLDGQVRNHGYYEYVFLTGGQQFPTSGNNAPLPQGWNTGGFSVGVESGEWAYSFPVDLALTPDLAADLDVVLEVNMFESFRWQDQDQPGYAPGVFDTNPIVSEPVVHFGANSYWLTLEP